MTGPRVRAAAIAAVLAVVSSAFPAESRPMSRPSTRCSGVRGPGREEGRPRPDGTFRARLCGFRGRDPAGTLRLVTDYLDRYRGIVIHLLGARIGDVGPDGRASVECEVSLSHGAAEVLRKLIRYTGEYYRFRIDLRKNERGEWRLTYAEWQSIGLAELFPESLDILKKLFPGL